MLNLPMLPPPSPVRLQTVNILYITNRKHGLHPARESGKEPCAGLKNHSPLEEESVRQGRARSRTGGGNGIGEIATSETQPAVVPEGVERCAHK